MKQAYLNEMKKVYFIGISGTTMAPLAKAFKDMGWQVTGSDQKKVYPPISTYLEKNNIVYFKGYREENVPRDADLVIVGYGALLINSQNPEYYLAKKLGLTVKSYPEVLKEFLVKENSVVVAGTYGKTTISSLLSWILTKGGLNPSYMTGGVSLNLIDGVKLSDSNYSVVEGDEVPALKETDPPKFMFYKPKYLILTATKHDHPEIYKTKEDYLKAFSELVKLLPPDGLLVYNFDSVDEAVIKEAKCRKVSYSLTNKQADYFVKDISIGKEITDFTVQTPKETIPLTTILIGKHNLENICGAVALCKEISIEVGVIKGGVEEFKGVKTRLEFLGKIGDRFLYRDFAQHPEKVRGSLEALREHFPTKKIFCIFNPATTGLKYKESLSWFKGAFDQADEVIVGKVTFLKSIDKKERVTGKDISEAISQTQKNVFYNRFANCTEVVKRLKAYAYNRFANCTEVVKRLKAYAYNRFAVESLSEKTLGLQPRVAYEPIDEKIISYLITKTKNGDVIVFMSSGGLRFTNLIQETINKLKD